MTPSAMPLTTASTIVNPPASFAVPADDEVRAFLRALVQDRSRHAAFLNMLSMLEHMGSRKIMLSQMNRVMPEFTLKHLAEEARHAFFFKRQADRIAGKELEGYNDGNTFARTAASMYFGRLSAIVHRQVGGDAAYPWTTYLVELRACWFYELYEGVLQQTQTRLSLRSLLAEEEGHLDEISRLCKENCPDGDGVLHTLREKEADLFARLWQGLIAA